MSHKQVLPKSDRRAQQISKILGKKMVGELFVGYMDGPLGKASVECLPDGDVCLNIDWGNRNAAASDATGDEMDLTVVIPYCRPQTCRKILREAACLGIGRLIFVHADRAEKEYASSSLWTSGEWKTLLFQGIEQAFDTRLPKVEILGSGLETVLAQFDKGDAGHEEVRKIALDNYESELELGEAVGISQSHLLVIGPERGWSDRERGLLRSSGVVLAHMGHRVLRTETALTVACGVVNSRCGAWTRGDSLKFLEGQGF